MPAVGTRPWSQVERAVGNVYTMNSARAAFAVNTYPFTPRLSARDCLNHLADDGYRAFEIMLVPGHYWPSLDGGARERRRMAALLRERDLRIVTLNQPNLDINLSSAVPEMRAHTCAVVIEAMRLAGDWGATGVIVNPGKANPMLPANPAALGDWFRRSLDVLVPAAHQTGVRIIVKNHPLSYLYRADKLLEFFDSYGWEKVSIGYDVANGVFGREDPCAALRLLGDHLGLVYAADTRSIAFVMPPSARAAYRFGTSRRHCAPLATPPRRCSRSSRTIRTKAWR